jgi:hypothetical protein
VAQSASWKDTIVGPVEPAAHHSEKDSTTTIELACNFKTKFPVNHEQYAKQLCEASAHEPICQMVAMDQDFRANTT